jgi:putative FmdB family regulatory protein
MPNYDYQCFACDHVFEEFQKISDKPIEVCPKCGKHEVKRLVSATSFHLKGGGWYASGYSSAKAATESSGHTCSGSCSHGAPKETAAPKETKKAESSTD